MNRLIRKGTLSKLDGSYIKLLNHLMRQTLSYLMILDCRNLSQEVTSYLIAIAGDRYGKKSIIITSQLPVAKWYEYINDLRLQMSILDRLTADAHRIELKGNRVRRKKSENILVNHVFLCIIKLLQLLPLPGWVNMQEEWVNITGIYTNQASARD